MDQNLSADLRVPFERQLLVVHFSCGAQQSPAREKTDCLLTLVSC